MPDLQFIEPESFGPSTMPFSQGVRAELMVPGPLVEIQATAVL